MERGPCLFDSPVPWVSHRSINPRTATSQPTRFKGASLETSPVFRVFCFDVFICLTSPKLLEMVSNADSGMNHSN